MATSLSSVKPWRDWQLGAALLAAPCVWAALYLLDLPRAGSGILHISPLRYMMLALVYPVLEETVFRGGLQPMLRTMRWGDRSLFGITTANIVTSVLFASMHFFVNPSYFSLSVILPSLVFGYFRDRHNVLLTPVLLHVFYNSGFVAIFAGSPGQ